MPDSATSRRRVRIGAAVLAVVCTSWGTTAFAKERPYTPKNGILNWKTVIFGGGFRVTTAVPLRGNFSKYDRVEIVRATSLIGPDVPRRVLDQLTAGLAKEFRQGGHVSAIAIVEAAGLPASPRPTADTAGETTFRDADPVDAPMRAWTDLLAFDRQRRLAATEDEASGTLVVRSEVIDYAKGNKFLQFLFLDLGNALLTLRVSYFDKATGEELGRSVISSDNSSSVVPSAFSTRSALTGVIGGLIDQVTRRKIAGER